MNTFFGQTAVAGQAGRRSRVRRRAAMLVIAPTSAYLLLMTSSLLGGPTFNSPLLPYAAGQAPTEPQAGLLPVGPGGGTSVWMEGMPPTPDGADDSTPVGPGDPALDVKLPDVVVPAGTANRGAPTVGQQQPGSTGTASAGKTQPKTGTQTSPTKQTTTSKTGTTTASKPATKPTAPTTSQPTQPAEPPAAPPPAEEPADPPAASGPLEPVVEILTPVVDPVVDLLEGVGGLLGGP
ncbi:hypothetical protein [Kribbella sp. VKM Ac-2568]|uniref:hypothetical protein n=1 Tax=Kribbella sp. VKM Ac-2568 TaxID=2512219 RepID=UPI00104C30AA|nr:hypothetical protein [Kribbella sp. VKM Ac-2568]